MQASIPKSAAGEPSLLSTSIGRLRVVAFAEGWSYLLLLFVAMPLKYLAGYPMAVRIVGSVHGALFVLFCLALAQTMMARRWPLVRAASVFGASLVPFGTFVLEPELRREQETDRNVLQAA